MPFWIWSKTSAINASIDPTINFAEGQSPSSLNDSDRAVMARLAEYRDDVSGLLVTGGASTAYSLTTNQGLASTPNDGQLIAFTPHTTNGLNATITADGGTPYFIQTSPSVNAPAGTLIQGTPYTAAFSTASGWVLRGFFGNPYAVPLGGIMAFCGDTAPNSNFVLPFGQAISRTTYATFFAQVATRFGVGNGTTTFNIPDLRGRVVAIIDNLGGTPAGILTSTTMTPDGNTIGASGGAQTETLTLGQLPTGITSVNAAQAISVTSTNALIDATGVLQDFNPVTAAGFRAPNNTASLRTQTSSGNNSIAVTSNNTSGQAHVNVQPSLALGCILRII